MNRTANVASTPPGKDNLNHIRVPEFGVAKLALKAGAKASKSYQPDGAGNRPSDPSGEDNFHFAPSVEKAQIVYEIVDPFGAIQGAKLELFCRYKQDALWTLDFAVLGPTWWAHGTHNVTWDGRVVAPDAAHNDAQSSDGYVHDLTSIAISTSFPGFPDNYVNLAHTAYKLKITLAAGTAGNPNIAWTYFHVLAEKIALEFGPPEVLPPAAPNKGDHRAVRADLVGREPTPPTGKTVKVFLESDIFKAGGGQMADNSLYTVYEALWEAGPMIPLFAKVTIRNSGDVGVDAPKALGDVKFLWDWESKSAAVATGKHSDAFINDAQTFDVATTKPKGQNCHKERGGKRSTVADLAAAVFPAMAGYAPKDALDAGLFPFKVEPLPDRRKWSTYSYAWREKALAGKTGVIFQPSRMAGDSYTVTVYLAWDVDENDKNVLDIDDDALSVPAPRQVSASTGTYQVWRRTHLRKYLAKTAAGMPAVNTATICSCYPDAFMEVRDVAGGQKTVSAAAWNTNFTNATSGWDAWNKMLVDPAVNQYTAGATGVTFRTRDQFTLAWKIVSIEPALRALGLHPGDATSIASAAAAAASAAAAATAASTAAAALPYAVNVAAVGAAASSGWQTVDTWMNNPMGLFSDTQKYAKYLQTKAIEILQFIFNTQFDADPGVTIFQVESSHNLYADQGSFTIGLACDFPTAQSTAPPNRCGFLLMCPAGIVPCGIDKISAHEIGHHYFLPHPLDTAERVDYHCHDQIVPSQCLMSYNYALAMHLCGFCQLRLRGWDKGNLNTSGAANKRPP